MHIFLSHNYIIIIYILYIYIISLVRQYDQIKSVDLDSREVHVLMEGKINVDHNYIWTCKRGSIGRGGGGGGENV